MTRYFVVLAIALSTAAQARTTPVGTWHSIDDATGKPKAEIIVGDGGKTLQVRSYIGPFFSNQLRQRVQ